MDARSPVIYCIGGHRDPEVIGEGIDGGRPNAAARRATCHHKRIDSEVNQVTHQRCSEERTRMSFRQHNILRARPDPVNELVALLRNCHDRRHFRAEPAGIVCVLRRHERVQHRQVPAPEYGQQVCSLVDCRPAHVTAARGVILQRFEERLGRIPDGPVLDIDDHKRGLGAHADGAAEAGGRVAFLVFGADVVAPRSGTGTRLLGRGHHVISPASVSAAAPLCARGR